jgi:hypothetical protein
MRAFEKTRQQTNSLLSLDTNSGDFARSVQGSGEKADSGSTIRIGEDMLKFEINLRVKEKIRAKCTRHPKYDPSLDQRLHSESGCTACTDIRNLHAARIALEDAARAFERRAYQWRIARVAKPKEGISVD